MYGHHNQGAGHSYILGPRYCWWYHGIAISRSMDWLKNARPQSFKVPFNRFWKICINMYQLYSNIVKYSYQVESADTSISIPNKNLIKCFVLRLWLPPQSSGRLRAAWHIHGITKWMAAIYRGLWKKPPWYFGVDQRLDKAIGPSWSNWSIICSHDDHKDENLTKVLVSRLSWSIIDACHSIILRGKSWSRGVSKSRSQCGKRRNHPYFGLAQMVQISAYLWMHETHQPQMVWHGLASLAG